MKSSLVLDLIHTHSVGNEDDFKNAVEKLADDEDNKGNSVLAMDIRKAYRDLPYNQPTNEKKSIGNLFLSPQTALDGLVTVIEPDIDLDDVIRDTNLDDRISQILRSWEEIWALPDGISPISKVLMTGPPGCGKTMTAMAIANRLKKRIAYVSIGNLFSMYFGQTGSNVNRIFDYVSKNGLMLFLDEFDSLGRDRSLEDIGESKRIIGSVLQNIDNYSHLMIIAATNRPDDLDKAIVRRFDITVRFGLPDADGRKRMIASLMERYLNDIRYDLDGMTIRTVGMSFAEVKSFLESLIRSVLLKTGKSEVIEGELHIDNSDFIEFDLRKMKDSGMTIREIEKVTGIPRSTISYRLRRGIDG